MGGGGGGGGGFQDWNVKELEISTWNEERVRGGERLGLIFFQFRRRSMTTNFQFLSKFKKKKNLNRFQAAVSIIWNIFFYKQSGGAGSRVQ